MLFYRLCKKSTACAKMLFDIECICKNMLRGEACEYNPLRTRNRKIRACKRAFGAARLPLPQYLYKRLFGLMGYGFCRFIFLRHDIVLLFHHNVCNAGNGVFGRSVNVHLAAAIGSKVYAGMLQNIEFIIHHGAFPSDKQQGFRVVEHTHLVGGQQLSSRVLIVGAVIAAMSRGLAVGVGINGGLAE